MSVTAPEEKRSTQAAAGAAAAPPNHPILRNPRRLLLFNLISKEWGLCETDLGRLSGLGRSNVKYHLQRLARTKLVLGRRQGRRVNYFPRESRLVDLQRAISSAQNPTRREILRLAREHPELSWRAISRVVGITPRAVRWHMQHLTGLGLIELERDGMYCRARISPVLCAVLDQFPAAAGTAELLDAPKLALPPLLRGGPGSGAGPGAPLPLDGLRGTELDPATP